MQHSSACFLVADSALGQLLGAAMIMERSSRPLQGLSLLVDSNKKGESDKDATSGSEKSPL